MTRRLKLRAAATLVALTTTLVTGSQIGAAVGSLAGAADGAGGDRVAADSSWGPRPGKPGRG